MNRLKDASYQKSSSELHNYDENLTYDKNGNILTLLRYTHNSDGQIGAMKMDELTYDYKSSTSNQLMRVTESTSGNASRGFVDGNTTGDDYVYDANGNMTVDKNKKITSIVYNHLNLPTKIVFPTGNIVYFYTASGQKVQKVVTENTTVTTTDYLGGYQYQNTVLQFFPTAEGYVKNTPVSGTNTYSYVFNYTDHLGNVRVSYAQNLSTNALTILDENNYYPFGLKHDGYNPIAPAPEYKYKFNGKELQDENIGGNQLNLYDYGARNYDPALGRWMNVDPLAEQMRRWSPYNYVFNNPLRFIDPDGMGPNDHIFDAHGNFLRDTKVGNAVKIQIGDKQYSPSQLDTSRGSRATMSKIGAYYAGKVGADAGTKITTGKGDDSSNKNPAYTTGTAISINVNGGFSKDLDDISNFKSVMKHENGHKEDNEKPNFKGDISTHADVYVDQMSDNSFSSTTSDFKIGSAGSFGNYLLNMDKSTEFSQNDIISKMNSFNQTNTGGLQIKRSGDNFGNFPKGSLSLELKYKGLTYPIPYEKVKN